MLDNSYIIAPYKAGFGKGTHLYAVGDGATWIADQVEKQFGAQSSYLVDIYHICDYFCGGCKSLCA